jgi:murein DD-endopeptidase MepM/ murein hydrolase activator NlpD
MTDSRRTKNSRLCRSLAVALLLPLLAQANAMAVTYRFQVAKSTKSSGSKSASVKEYGSSSPVVSTDARDRLRDIEQRRRELHEAAAQARKKEQIAILHLHTIQTQLNVTQGVLHTHQQHLAHTENQITETQQNIKQTKTAEESLTEQASRRLREIFEGQRMSLVEQLFQVDSLQSLLDRAYYEERVAELDRGILRELRAKADALNAKKNKLGAQKNQLGDLVSEFARKAMEFAKQKSTEEQVAEKLRTQRAFYEQAEERLAAESQQLESKIRAMEMNIRRTNKNAVMGSGTMAYPLHAQVTSPFGWRKHPIFGVRKFHTGVDLAGPNHSPIRAADAGSVLYTGWYGGYGNVVIISHGKGMATLYAHMCRTAVTAGQNVSKGDIVGYEGTTGFSTGPHLHFEVRVDGKPNNPLSYLH